MTGYWWAGITVDVWPVASRTLVFQQLDTHKNHKTDKYPDINACKMIMALTVATIIYCNILTGNDNHSKCLVPESLGSSQDVMAAQSHSISMLLVRLWTVVKWVENGEKNLITGFHLVTHSWVTAIYCYKFLGSFFKRCVCTDPFTQRCSSTHPRFDYSTHKHSPTHTVSNTHKHFHSISHTHKHT